RVAMLGDDGMLIAVILEVPDLFQKDRHHHLVAEFVGVVEKRRAERGRGRRDAGRKAARGSYGGEAEDVRECRPHGARYGQFALRLPVTGPSMLRWARLWPRLAADDSGGGRDVTVLRIAGFDPGLTRTGWGVIEVSGTRLAHIANGAVATSASLTLGARLA